MADKTEPNSQNATLLVSSHETAVDDTTTNETGNEILGSGTTSETASGSNTTTSTEVNQGQSVSSSETGSPTTAPHPPPHKNTRSCSPRDTTPTQQPRHPP